ncbi:hypothetical protein AAMO2058_001200600 [Amorphochlora amoebiformis]
MGPALVLCFLGVFADQKSNNTRGRGDWRRRLGGGFRRFGKIVGGTLQIPHKAFLGARDRVGAAIIRRRQRVSVSQGELMWENGEDIEGEGVGGGGIWCFFCRIPQPPTCIPGAGPQLLAGLEGVLPRSLWVPNIPAMGGRLAMSAVSAFMGSARSKNLSSDASSTSDDGMTGRWVKVAALNENSVLSRLGYSRLQRAVIEKLSVPLDIELTSSNFIVKTNTLRSFHTRYPLDGQEISYSRRDGRPGNCRAKVVTATNDSIVLHLDWDHPFGGWNIQTYRIQYPEQDTFSTKILTKTLIVENKITLHPVLHPFFLPILFLSSILSLIHSSSLSLSLFLSLFSNTHSSLTKT